MKHEPLQINGVFPSCPILKIQVNKFLGTVGIVFIGVLIKDQIKLTIVCFYIVFGLKTPLTLNTITYLINISYIGQYHIKCNKFIHYK